MQKNSKLTNKTVDHVPPPYGPILTTALGYCAKPCLVGSQFLWHEGVLVLVLLVLVVVLWGEL